MLQHVQFAVFGLGSSDYVENFNVFAKQVDRQLVRLGGQRLIQLGVGMTFPIKILVHLSSISLQIWMRPKEGTALLTLHNCFTGDENEAGGKREKSFERWSRHAVAFAFSEDTKSIDIAAAAEVEQDFEDEEDYDSDEYEEDDGGTPYSVLPAFARCSDVSMGRICLSY